MVALRKRSGDLWEKDERDVKKPRSQSNRLAPWCGAISGRSLSSEAQAMRVGDGQVLMEWLEEPMGTLGGYPIPAQLAGDYWPAGDASDRLYGGLEVWPESGGSRVSGYTWGQQV